MRESLHWSENDPDAVFLSSPSCSLFPPLQLSVVLLSLPRLGKVERVKVLIFGEEKRGKDKESSFDW